MAPESSRPEVLARGTRIGLRRSVPADLDNITRWEADPANARFIPVWPIDEHKRALEDGSYLHLAVQTPTDELVGFVVLAGIGNPNRSIEFKRIVIGPKGLGYGRETVWLVKQLAFEQLGAHRLWLDVKDFNSHAMRLYESEGFAVEGTLRECVRTAHGYESLVVMSMLESEYQP